MRLWTALGAALTSAMFIAATAFSATVPVLEGTEWGPENGLGQYVQFKDGGDVFGFAGCNTFIARYTQKGDQLNVTNVTVTKKSCDGMMGAEAAFLDGIKGSHRLDMVRGDIRVYDKDDRWILGLRQRN